MELGILEGEMDGEVDGTFEGDVLGDRDGVELGSWLVDGTSDGAELAEGE